MEAARLEVRNEFQQRAEQAIMTAAGGMPARVPINVSAPGGSQLHGWGDIFGGLIKFAGETYGQKELLKQQTKLAESLAEAEAKKMLAQVELQLAQATSLQQAAVLQTKQNELQSILREIQFSGVQKWLLAAAGTLTLVLIGLVAYRKLIKPRARRRAARPRARPVRRR
jgi:hypothetical protein